MPEPTAQVPAARVALATFNRPNGVTGVHTHARLLMRGLAEAGVACEFVSPFSGSRLWTPLFAVRPFLLEKTMPSQGTLWHRHWHAAALRTNLRAVLRRGGVDHVIAQCPPSAQAAMDVRTELGRPDIGVTMVCHFNASEADEYRDQGILAGRAYDRVKAEEERTLRAVDRVIYVSSWARELVERERGIATRASAVVWNGVAADQADAPPLERAAIGADADDLLLINVGTLEPRKDQLGLLDLFARLLQTCHRARLLLVGDGPQRAAIETKTRSLGVAHRVTLLGHRSDVPSLLRTADLYVHHAAAENCPMVLLEASRAALPWAGRQSGGVAELAKALHGVALPSDAVDESVDLLSPLLADAALRRRTGALTRNAFFERFTHTAMTQAYLHAIGLAARARRAA